MTKLPQINAVILAAGEGKRLKLKTSKPLAELCGQRLIDYPIQEFTLFLQKHNLKGQIGLVVGHEKEALTDYILNKYGSNHPAPLNFMVQEEQRGTADALKAYFKGISKADQGEYTLVLCADTPLIRSDDLEQLFSCMLQNSELLGTVATFNRQNPTGYGRIVKALTNKGLHIVEEKDASPEIKKIEEVNSGLYIFRTDFIRSQLDLITNQNQSGEFYLTDVFKDHLPLQPVLFNEGDKFVGVNDLEQLEWVERKLRQEKVRKLRENGVRFIESQTAFVDWSVSIGEKTVIYPNSFIEGQTTIGTQSIIGPGCVIKDCQIASDVVIKPYSCLEKSIVETKAQVGPFAHLRPGSEIGPESKIGNFVETKKAKLARGVKVSHLSYVGDAFIGEESNIGCGFITCNYDGLNKHITTIGKAVFVGSDCQAVAPVTIGDNAFVAAGSTVTNNVPSGAFAISRGRQVTKEGMAMRFMKKKSQE